MADHRLARLLMLLAFAALAGCGQKGPLYLPDQAREIVTRPAVSSAPGETHEAPSSPHTTDTPQQPANPAPEVSAPGDKEKKEPGAVPPR
jgi:predicted small lipoprotein YifL